LIAPLIPFLLEKNIMEAAVRIGVSLAVVIGVSLGALHVDRKWLGARVGDLWSLPTQFVKARQAEEQGDSIKLQHEILRERVERKKEIARAVFTGHLSLSAAAEQFFQVSKDATYDWDSYRDTHPHRSLRARCAMLVIDDVRQLSIDEEKDPGAITSALRREVAAWEGQ
jgi:hypothetical protein